MKQEISLSEKIIWVVESFITNKISRATVSYNGKKKFSDVVAYIKSGKFGTDIGSRVLRETDNGTIFNYEYDFGKGCSFRVTICHRGEVIKSMEYERNCRGAIFTVKNHLNTMDEALEDFEGEAVDAVEVIEVKKVDYSVNTLNELVDIFDKKLQELSKNPTVAVVSEIADIKNAMNDKINEKPVAERAPFKKPIGDMGMFIDALSMQVSAGSTQFVGTYVPQIETALSELASLLS